MIKGESGPERKPSDLSHLYVDQILPLDAFTLAKTTPSNELQGRAIAEHAIAEGLRAQAAEKRAELALIETKIEDTEARKATLLEAYQMSISEERGE